jgi:quercetin dioxygenase-like cupin family protein
LAYSVIHSDEIDPAGQEVAFVFAGAGHWLVDGEQVPVRAGSFIRFDAGTVRRPMAGGDGLSFVAVGCPPGGYKPHGPF